MNDDPLTPLERSAFNRLQAKAAKADPEARATRERQLREQQEVLALKEERAARRLSVLQSKLDETTCELTGLLNKQKHHVTGHIYRDNERARAELHRLSARIRDRLPDYVAKGYGADADWIQHAFEMWLETTFPTLLAPADNVLPFPPKKDDDNAL